MKCKTVCYLEYSNSDSLHTVPAETATAASDASANPQQNLQLWSVSRGLGVVVHAAAHWLFKLIDYMIQAGGAAGKYFLTRGSAGGGRPQGEVHAHNTIHRCSHLCEQSDGCVVKARATCSEENRGSELIDAAVDAASPPSYRCATCRRWGTSGSDSTGTCCGISCECDSEDHSDRKPALIWLCVWRNPKSKKKKKKKRHLLHISVLFLRTVLS